ncbi:MAG: DNA translocase FtsK 4TM domain-containing protein [Alphaproteobacteria bacterium]|nr:DNA translocase FtsK 4TM domain-containing protein [Alphaproteobacteria bacterium]
MAKKQKKASLYYIISRRVYAFILIAAALVFWGAICFYSRTDSCIDHAGNRITNLLGSFGADSACIILTWTGLALPIFLAAFCAWGWRLCKLSAISYKWARLIAWFLGIAPCAVFLDKFKLGGKLGEVLITHITAELPKFQFKSEILSAVSFTAFFLLLNFAALIPLKFWYDCLIKTLVIIKRIGKLLLRFLRLMFNRIKNFKFSHPQEDKKEPVFSTAKDEGEPSIIRAPQVSAENKKEPVKNVASKKVSSGEYNYPGLYLLSKPQNKNSSGITEKELENIARKLEGVLQEFGVNGKIVKIRPGPVVTLYELEPAPGIKTARVIGLADDIARSMSAVSVRIAVVTGKNTIGIELPNSAREIVWLRELFEDDNFIHSKNTLNIVLGKDIGGTNTYADLAKMPHLLVAGTTGSGKSVGMNSMILSILFKMRPDECKLIMIDPKMLEFSVYNGIPHLLTPVITDPVKAVLGLKWAVKEMEDRYRAMAQLNVRNISGYNKRLEELRKEKEKPVRTVQTGFDPETGAPIFEEQEIDLTPLPYIVIVVDEMADLMLVAGKEVEAAIQRLAQMARAAGIHLILSTQRPSVDVITGVIKANFPTRISFQVTSKIDSRTILNEQGAEQLLGMGDMLYMPAGQRPQRVHGSYVKDSEVEAIVEFLKSQSSPDYIEEVTQGELTTKDGGAVFDKGSFMGDTPNDDEGLYARAVEIVKNDKKTSISYVQRRLRIGYNRAAMLIERMEDEGIITPADHTGKRSIIE